MPLLAGVLSGPLLKLMLIRRTGRFETRDLPLLALFSCLTMAMLTVVLLAFHLWDRNTERLELKFQGSGGPPRRPGARLFSPGPSRARRGWTHLRSSWTAQSRAHRWR